MLLCKVNKYNWQLGEKYAGSKTNFASVFELQACLQVSNVNFVIVHTQKPVWKFSFPLGLVSHSFAPLYRPSENKECHSESFCRSQSPNCSMCCGSFFLMECDTTEVCEHSLSVCVNQFDHQWSIKKKTFPVPHSLFGWWRMFKLHYNLER